MPNPTEGERAQQFLAQEDDRDVQRAVRDLDGEVQDGASPISERDMLAMAAAHWHEPDWRFGFLVRAPNHYLHVKAALGEPVDPKALSQVKKVVK